MPYSSEIWRSLKASSNWSISRSSMSRRSFIYKPHCIHAKLAFSKPAQRRQMLFSGTISSEGLDKDQSERPRFQLHCGRLKPMIKADASCHINLFMSAGSRREGSCLCKVTAHRRHSWVLSAWWGQPGAPTTIVCLGKFVLPEISSRTFPSRLVCRVLLPTDEAGLHDNDVRSTGYAQGKGRLGRQAPSAAE